MFHLSLSLKENEKFQLIHYNVHNRKRVNINSRICYNEKDNKHYHKFKDIVDKSYNIIKELNINNLVFNPKKYTIEFIQRNHFDGFWKTANPLFGIKMIMEQQLEKYLQLFIM